MRWIFFLVFIVLVVVGVAYLARPAEKVEMIYGVSYADRMAKSLGLNPDDVYFGLLDELQIKKIRLAAYWDEIEPVEGEYNFERLDFLLDEAHKRDAKVVLAVGQKLPRWPECFYPEWVKNDNVDREVALLTMLQTVVTRYDKHPAVELWQLENEPFVGWFGECPKPNSSLLRQEEALIKSLSKKPIVITDSGELSSWRKAARFSDVFGTTMYRVTWNEYWGYGVYPLPPAFYRLKARLWGLQPSAVVISELQAEPWPPGTHLPQTPIEEQLKSMSLNRFTEQINFATDTGFREAWLWGVEWWYWMKQNGHPEFWEAARNIYK